MPRHKDVRLAFLILVLLCGGCASAHSAGPAPSSSDAGGSVRALWQPDVNWSNARQVATEAGARIAARLRHDLAVAPRFPPGAFACAVDTGAGVRLVIRAAGKVERVAVRLTGCRDATIASHRARIVTPAIRADLRGIAPARWQVYLRSG